MEQLSRWDDFPLLSYPECSPRDRPIQPARSPIARKAVPHRFNNSDLTLRGTDTSANSQSSKSRFKLRKTSTTFRLKSSLPNQGRDVAQWGLDWYSPTLMLCLLLLGLLAMLSHHLYNKSLNGKVLNDPQWPQRFGTVLAILVTMCLSASIEIAYVQLVWLFVRKRPYEIKTLDSLFSICHRPKSFLNTELLLKATLPTIIGSLIWFMPFCSILPPASLTSISGIQSSNASCNVSSLNFEHENGYNIDNNMGAPGQASALFSLDPRDNLTFYYNSPSMDLERYFKLASLSDSGYLQLPSPCRSDTNCTYTFSFNGPSYNCIERPEFANSTELNKSMLIPEGDWLYLSSFDRAEDPFGRPQSWADMTPDNNTDLGTFFKEPSLWIGYTVNSTEPIVVEPSAAWHFRMEPHVYECVLSNATYTHAIDFVGGIMRISSSAVKILGPLLPAGSSLPPSDPNYESFSAQHAAGFLYRTALAGNMSQSTDHGLLDYAISNSAIQQMSGLLDHYTQTPPPDFASRVMRQFSNIILSLAADRDLYSHVNTLVPCTTSTIVLQWKYKPFWLTLTYSLGIAAAVLSVGVGLYSMRMNGYCADDSFSTVLSTTRNGTLDRVSKGCCLGQASLPRDFMKTRLRFGQVEGGGDARHLAFGEPDETTDVVFGEKYK